MAARARSDNLRLKRRRRAQRKQSLRPLFFCFADTQDALSTRRHFTPGLVEKLREDCPVYGAFRSAFYNCRNLRQIQPLKHVLFSTAFHAIYQEKSPWLPPLYASGAKRQKGIRGTDAACAAVGIADSPPRCDLRVANAASARRSQMPSQDVRQRAWVPAERHMKRDGGEKPSVPIETVDAAVIEATTPAVRGRSLRFRGGPHHEAQRAAG